VRDDSGDVLAALSEPGVNDAERRFSEDRMGIGIVVRDDSGDVLAALSEPGVNDGNNLWRMAKSYFKSSSFLC
jgi:hypothetical protein